MMSLELKDMDILQILHMVARLKVLDIALPLRPLFMVTHLAHLNLDMAFTLQALLIVTHLTELHLDLTFPLRGRLIVARLKALHTAISLDTLTPVRTAPTTLALSGLPLPIKCLALDGMIHMPLAFTVTQDRAAGLVM